MKVFSRLVLFLIIVVTKCQGSSEVQPSEFLRSFMCRGGKLPNASSIDHYQHALAQDATPTVVVIIDNWSLFSLVYSDSLHSAGVVDPNFSPRNLPQKKRSVAVKVSASESSPSMTGMAGWTLVEPKTGMKVAKVSVGWQVTQPAEAALTARQALALGDFVPDLNDMWKKTWNSRITVKNCGKRCLDRTLAVADSRVTVATRLTESDKGRLELHVTIIPQNVDIWGWLKYFSSEVESRVDDGNWHKRSQSQDERKEQQQEALPKTQMMDDSTNEKRDNNELDPGSPLFHRKDLLKPGKSVLRVEEAGHGGIRHVLRSDWVNHHSVAVGFLIENWSRFRLATPTVDFKSGSALDELPLSSVSPGRIEIAVVGNEQALHGTSGVVRWNIGESTGKILSIMWSVPFNLQFYSTWLAVGITKAKEPLPTFSEMYSSKDPSRFVRVKAGHEFEFSDGEFIVFAFMDGDASSKPVLHFGLVPIKQPDLSSHVLHGLGIVATRPDEKGTPRLGLVQDEAGSAAQMLNSGANLPHFPLHYLLLMSISSVLNLSLVMMS